METRGAGDSRGGSAALKFRGAQEGGAGPDTGRVIDLEVPICSN